MTARKSQCAAVVLNNYGLFESDRGPHHSSHPSTTALKLTLLSDGKHNIVIMRQSRGREATEAVSAKKNFIMRPFFAYRQKSLLIMRPFLPIGKKASSYRGAYRVPLCN